ncbi:MAG: Stp1/IreP family PP2C-type Ser/Thr phosphatase [Deltaproteobacteria bacterium]
MLNVGACSDKGIIRQINEDSFYIPLETADDSIMLFIVADGMGGHMAGEIASREAVDAVVWYINENYEKEARNVRSNLINLINESILYANKQIYEKSLSDNNLNGMGTTFAIALIHNESLYIGHVGDSRIYLLRKNNLCQLTRDHSYVEELVSSGTITREEAANHPQKNIITRALGTEKIVEIDICVRKIYKNDTLLLCTDGLTNMVDEETIKTVLESTEVSKESAEKLVDLANQAGGTDNITVVVVNN